MRPLENVIRACRQREDHGIPRKGPPYELQSKFLKGEYIGDYIGDYYRGY